MTVETPSRIPPWTFPPLRCCAPYVDGRKDQLPPAALRGLFVEHRESFHPGCHIYTDGSRSSDGVGCAAIVPSRSLRARLPSHASVLSAELTAISFAVDALRNFASGSYTVFTDSRSAIQCLPSIYPRHPVAVRILESLYMLFDLDIQVTFCWTPAHVDIRGNELADRAAKCAARSVGPALFQPFTYHRDFVPLIRRLVRERWQSEWLAVGHAHLLAIRDTTDPWSSAFLKSRRREVVLCRLRIGHCRLTHGFLMSGSAPTLCDRCGTRLTVRHVLLDCPHYASGRRIYFGPRPSLASVLGDDPEFLEPLFMFLGTKRGSKQRIELLGNWVIRRDEGSYRRASGQRGPRTSGKDRDRTTRGDR